jgi:addiction module RelE/StbE family toxin
VRIRWTAPAAQDLYEITRHIRQDNPTAAREVAKTIYDACEGLQKFPYRGRKGFAEGTRELVIPGLPYIAVYAIGKEAVEITRIIHGARQRPY